MKDHCKRTEHQRDGTGEHRDVTVRHCGGKILHSYEQENSVMEQIICFTEDAVMRMGD